MHCATYGQDNLHQKQRWYMTGERGHTVTGNISTTPRRCAKTGAAPLRRAQERANSGQGTKRTTCALENWTDTVSYQTTCELKKTAQPQTNILHFVPQISS